MAALGLWRSAFSSALVPMSDKKADLLGRHAALRFAGWFLGLPDTMWSQMTLADKGHGQSLGFDSADRFAYVLVAGAVGSGSHGWFVSLGRNHRLA